ncbi:MAG: hypothetical protein HWE08_03135, partial [Alphaproteobacteria bacterium]|nr:hypothetical protein [Alphaproteobacteria bacterium]
MSILNGDTTGLVTEDVDYDGDGFLETNGQLSYTTDGETFLNFTPAALSGTYGTLTMSHNGYWSYEADNSQAAIQDLGYGDYLQESFTVSSVDGSSHTIQIDIEGQGNGIWISGDDIGHVTEDLDYDYDGVLQTDGFLSAS